MNIAKNIALSSLAFQGVAGSQEAVKRGPHLDTKPQVFTTGELSPIKEPYAVQLFTKTPDITTVGTCSGYITGIKSWSILGQIHPIYNTSVELFYCATILDIATATHCLDGVGEKIYALEFPSSNLKNLGKRNLQNPNPFTVLEENMSPYYQGCDSSKLRLLHIEDTQCNEETNWPDPVPPCPDSFYKKLETSPQFNGSFSGYGKGSSLADPENFNLSGITKGPGQIEGVFTFIQTLEYPYNRMPNYVNPTNCFNFDLPFDPNALPNDGLAQGDSGGSLFAYQNNDKESICRTSTVGSLFHKSYQVQLFRGLREEKHFKPPIEALSLTEVCELHLILKHSIDCTSVKTTSNPEVSMVVALAIGGSILGLFIIYLIYLLIVIEHAKQNDPELELAPV